MKNTSQFLFLASGSKNGEGFWFIGVKNSDENILSDKKLLDCHRKELIGYDSAKDILLAINLNLNNLLDQLEKNNYLIDRPTLGISFNIQLFVLEEIFDFWLNKYKEKSLGNLYRTFKVRRVSLLNLIKSGSLKGNSKEWALEIEKLHDYFPISAKNYLNKEPMWK